MGYPWAEYWAFYHANDLKGETNLLPSGMGNNWAQALLGERTRSPSLLGNDWANTMCTIGQPVYQLYRPSLGIYWRDRTFKMKACCWILMADLGARSKVHHLL